MKLNLQVLYRFIEGIHPLETVSRSSDPHGRSGERRARLHRAAQGERGPIVQILYPVHELACLLARAQSALLFRQESWTPPRWRIRVSGPVRWKPLSCVGSNWSSCPRICWTASTAVGSGDRWVRSSTERLSVERAGCRGELHTLHLESCTLSDRSFALATDHLAQNNVKLHHLTLRRWVATQETVSLH